MRTGDNMLDDAEAAIDGNAPHNGIKGPSALSLVVGVDIVAPIDYQHNFCLRVMAKLLRLWFDAKHHNMAFSVRNRVVDFDRLMTATRAPDFITRPPRNFSDYFKFWKAVELRSVLLYYGPIVLKHILPDNLYRHFLLLCEGLSIFLSQSIRPEEMILGQQMLNTFVVQFQVLYGQRFLSKTVHSLCHVSFCVEKTGPLWATSCFPFESFYRHLKDMVHGTRFVLHQLRHSVYTFRHFKVLSSQHLNDRQKEYVASLGVTLSSGEYDLQRRPDAKQVLEVHPHVYVLGKSNRALVTPVQADQIRLAAGVLPQTLIRHYRRAFIHEETIMGTTYRRSKMRNNAVVMYIEQDQMRFGQVHSFHVVNPNPGQLLMMVLLRPIVLVPGPFVQANGAFAAQMAGLNRRFFQVLPPV